MELQHLEIKPKKKKIYRMDMLGYNVRCNFFFVKVRGFIMKKIGICLGRST